MTIRVAHSSRSLVASGLLISAALGAASAAAQEVACTGGDRVVSVQVWGRPSTAFSPYPARSLGDLQDLFTRYEGDLRRIVVASGWDGDPDDLFRTVRLARQGDPDVLARSFESGTEFDWMAFRRSGRATCVREVRWAAPRSFEGWQIRVRSKGSESLFVLPKDCLNLALLKGSRRPLPAPVCELRAAFDPESDRIALSATTDGATLVLAAASGPDGAIALGGVAATGPKAWSLAPTADGAYRFAARATSADGLRTGTCEATVQVARARPVCSLDVQADPATGRLVVDGSRSRGELRPTGLTLPDGTSGDLSALSAIAENRWTVDVGSSLPRRPGTYPVRVRAESTLHGATEACSGETSVVRAPRGGRWTVRAYGARLDASDEDLRVTASGAAEERDLVALADGDGFGLGVEYLIRPRFGLEVDLLVADLDSHWMYDQAAIWLMDDRQVDVRAFGLGANFHLTPGRRFDLYAGPQVTWVDYGDVTFRDAGFTRSIRYGSDTGVGAKIGLDVPFGWQSPWAVSAGVRFLRTRLEGHDGGPRLDVDPLIGTLGLAYRF